jgi:hypothetical protein
MEEQNIFKTGDIVAETALYECTTCKEIKKTVRQRLQKGDSFPECKVCSDKGATKWQRASSDLDMPANLHS